MARIKLAPSMALDAVCFLDRYGQGGNYSGEQTAFFQKIEKQFPESAMKLKNDAPSMSNVGIMLTTYKENQSDYLENCTLDDLIEIFQNPKELRNTVKPRIKNEFLASFIFPTLDQFVDGWAEQYVEMLCELKKVGFHELWKTDLLPIIKEKIQQEEIKLSQLNIDGAFFDIQKLKDGESIDDVKIYVTVMSNPVAFQMNGNSFLTHNNGSIGTGLIYHELMHGFATDELTKLYLDYVRGIKYLDKQHDDLINKHNSGDEEEFVAAAEYYLRVKHDGECKDALLKHARKNYNGSMPTSVFLFDLLLQKPEVPDGYAQWLIDVFKTKKLPQQEIEHHLDSIVPKNPSEKFFEVLFDTFRRIMDKIYDIQNQAPIEAEKTIENITKKELIEISEKTVYYRQERQPLPNALRVKEIQVDNMFISVAEYVSWESALMDRLNNGGANISAPMEEINGEEYPLYYVNLAPMSDIVTTVGTSFVKDNYKITLTAKCPDHVVRIDETWEDYVVKHADEILLAQRKLENFIMLL